MAVTAKARHIRKMCENSASESFVTALVCHPESQIVSTMVLVPIILNP